MLYILLRISHVAGREGHAPDFLSYIHIEKKTPVAPILLNVRIGRMKRKE
jgi:L-type amino acid transporter 9